MVIIGILLNRFPIEIEWFGIADLSKELIFMGVGILLSEKIIQYEVKRRDVLVVLGCIAISVAVFCLGDRIKSTGWLAWLISSVIRILMIGTVMLTAKLIEKRAESNNKQKKELLQFIGKNAFTIYIYSWPMQAAAELLITVILGLHWLAVWTVMFFVGLIGPIVLSVLCKRFFPHSKFINSLVGVN